MKLLHIISTPRGRQSNTLAISAKFLEEAKAKYPSLIVEELDLFATDLPTVAGDNTTTKYLMMAHQLPESGWQEAWQPIENLVQQFLSADIYLLSVPMWNFNIPYVLKYYIDSIVQPGYLFKYNEQGQPIPLVHGKQMICVTARGGDYSAGSPFAPYDFMEPYLRGIFGFVGITDIQFIYAQPTDITPELREMAMTHALTAVSQFVTQTHWA